MERELKCVVSGSFKFKPEIDRAIEELTDLGVIVLSPEKGWVYKPPTRIFTLEDQQFRPLPSERTMTPEQIEQMFLSALANSNFVFVVNPGGYVGGTVSMEIGFAFGRDIPVFCLEPIDPGIDPDPAWRETVSKIPVLSIEEIVKIFKESDLASM